MINFLFFVVVIVLCCIGIIIYGNKSDKNGFLSFILPLLVSLFSVCMLVFLYLADDNMLSHIPFLRVEHEGIVEISNQYECKLEMKDASGSNYFYLTEYTPVEDLENFISLNTGACVFYIVNDSNCIYEEVYDKPSVDEIYNVFREWKATGKIDRNKTKIYWGIFYLNQV